MAAMANVVEVFKGSYVTNSNYGLTAHEYFTWVVWIGGERHTITVRRHFRTTYEYDGSRVQKNWHANGVTFRVKSETWGHAFKLYVNNTKFRDLRDITTQGGGTRRLPSPARAGGADVIFCGNCGDAGHYAVGCARPSNSTTSNSGSRVEVEVTADFEANTEDVGDGEPPSGDGDGDGDGDGGFLSDFLSSM
eukprot:g4174.t1